MIVLAANQLIFIMIGSRKMTSNLASVNFIMKTRQIMAIVIISIFSLSHVVFLHSQRVVKIRPN